MRDPVEDPEIRIHPLAGVRRLAPAAVSFLDGIELWRVAGYAGVTPIVEAYVAAGQGASIRQGLIMQLHVIGNEAVQILTYFVTPEGEPWQTNVQTPP